jgi:hypothetical protein
MQESTKSKLHFTPEERALIQGRVLDIGAGNDPVTPEAVPWDLEHGDANFITAFEPGSFSSPAASTASTPRTAWSTCTTRAARWPTGGPW